MKKTCYFILLIAAFTIGGTDNVSAFNDEEIEPADLTSTEQEPVFESKPAFSEIDFEKLKTPLFSRETEKIQMTLSAPENKPDFKFMDDLTFAGVPVFVAGIIAKSEKTAFRQNYDDNHSNTRLVTHFKSTLDNYTQYAPPAIALGLKIAGVEGRSDWLRFGASTAMSYAIMGAFVNSIKYTAKEMRPDGSTANSWPSGHTATAFVGATILHKEYGLTRSPWYSVAGYGIATATGVMRVLNNRHWVSDVLSGAGIGIMSGELAYAFSDLIFKDKHLLRGNINTRPDLNRDHPSFFDISMGIGFGSKELDFNEQMEYDYGVDYSVKLRASTVMQAEGAYFLNKYFGIGGRLRVKSSPVNGWSNLLDDGIKTFDSFKKIYDEDTQDEMKNLIQSSELTIVSDHLTEFAGDVGFYFNIPLSDRFAIGTKALIGRSVMQAIDIDAHVQGISKIEHYNMDIRDNELESFEITSITDGDPYDVSWDYLTIEGDNSTKWGTGISLTYAYKGNYCWKVFCDYDFTRKTYTMTSNDAYYYRVGMPESVAFINMMAGADVYVPSVYKIKKNMHNFVLGASFSISF